jgi:hypothetical protein
VKLTADILPVLQNAVILILLLFGIFLIIKAISLLFIGEKTTEKNAGVDNPKVEIPLLSEK